eukprot:6616_1
MKEENGSSIAVVSGILDIVGGSLMVLGPYGALAGSLCTLIAACLGFAIGGGGGKSMAELIKDMFDDLKDFMTKSLIEEKNDYIMEKVTVENRKYNVAMVFLETLITGQGINEDELKHLKDEDMKSSDAFEGYVNDRTQKDNILKLNQAELPQLLAVEYRDFGLDILGILEYQINKYKSLNDGNNNNTLRKKY